MRNVVVLSLLLSAATAFAGPQEIRIACKAAGKDIPHGTGATVYYPNGRTLTSSSGKAGATWYHPNGRTLTSSMGMPGATFYHSNGRTFSSSTGVEGATWYYANGSTMTSSGPALTPKEMAALACDLIMDGSTEP